MEVEKKKHQYRVGQHKMSWDDIPTEKSGLEKFTEDARKNIEPWLSAVCQADHLNLLLGSGFTAAVCQIAGTKAAGMSKAAFATTFDAKIQAAAKDTAAKMGRGAPNVEDQLRVAISLLEGLKIQGDAGAGTLQTSIDDVLSRFLNDLLATESGFVAGATRDFAELHLQSFLMSFGSRTATRERLHVFTTNYDRFIEHGCDLLGARTIDRFVGALRPRFRSSRIDVDMHYNPPGMRGEPRYLEGVLRLTKLHGSLDWRWDGSGRVVSRCGLPFGAPTVHSEIPKNLFETLMIYPNAAKDLETAEYPFVDLFRDFAAALCRSNSVVVTYGYGFGDDHVNRILKDMLTIPSTHLVVISRDVDDRLRTFLKQVRDAQITFLLGTHFSDLKMLVRHYLPKPALDTITGRMAELLKGRAPPPFRTESPEEGQPPDTSLPAVRVPVKPAETAPPEDDDIPF